MATIQANSFKTRLVKKKLDSSGLKRVFFFFFSRHTKQDVTLAHTRRLTDWENNVSSLHVQLSIDAQTSVELIEDFKKKRVSVSPLVCQVLRDSDRPELRHSAAETPSTLTLITAYVYGECEQIGLGGLRVPTGNHTHCHSALTSGRAVAGVSAQFGITRTSWGGGAFHNGTD